MGTNTRKTTSIVYKNLIKKQNENHFFAFMNTHDILMSMKKAIFTFLALFFTLNSQVFASGEGESLLGISYEKLREGNITLADIPVMIASAVEFLLSIAGSIAVVALIYHAVRMQIASGITGDSS